MLVAAGGSAVLADLVVPVDSNVVLAGLVSAPVAADNHVAADTEIAVLANTEDTVPETDTESVGPAFDIEPVEAADTGNAAAPVADTERAAAAPFAIADTEEVVAAAAGTESTVVVDREKIVGTAAYTGADAAAGS